MPSVHASVSGQVCLGPFLFLSESTNTFPYLDAEDRGFAAGGHRLIIGISLVSCVGDHPLSRKGHTWLPPSRLLFLSCFMEDCPLWRCILSGGYAIPLARYEPI